MWSTEPPVNPPEPKMVECRECDGKGEIYEHDGPLGPLVAVGRWCDECEGTGEVRFDPDDDPYAPDNWKEWEGIA